jgi:hypothetical protein
MWMGMEMGTEDKGWNIELKAASFDFEDGFGDEDSKGP